ncbi:MAG: hypothetical protein K6A78_04900 [Prevotella sp.]|nr:hypothetical protein [Prevotella sp.]
MYLLNKTACPLLAICTILLLPCSCKKGAGEAEAVYNITAETSSVYIDDWHVLGSFTQKQDSLQGKKLFANPEKCQLTANPDTTIKLWKNGVYHPKYNQLDLKEVFGINVNDTTKQLDTLVTYLSCTINADRERNMFLLVNSKMQHQQYINGKLLEHKRLRELELYPVRLKKGTNTLSVRTTGGNNRYWYEATLYDSAAVARLYAERHTGDIIKPIILNDSVTLTEPHWDITDRDVRLQFHDVYARKVADVLVRKGELTHSVTGLEKNHAYICSMVMGADTIRQPVMTWQPEEAEQAYTALRDTMFQQSKPVFFQAGERHPRADEIDNLLYRLWKLNTITGKMREDYWFDFKFPAVVYQLEHIFAHQDYTYGNADGENSLHLLTYRSSLDGGTQRYVLITPDKISPEKKYPLVLVVRPDNDKRYHLFFCPQIAHQYVVNNMLALANRYDTFIIMPEARMLQGEDLTPFAEAEMKLALADVQEHYNIDTDRIYIHANCSGGYRALRLAELNPEMFAGMALYAPAYHRGEDDLSIYTACAPNTMIRNLRNMPMLIYGDPADTHSPTKDFADLVKDCEDNGVPFTLTLRRNTGQGYHGYHRLVVGRDALEYFRDKTREKGRGTHYSFPPRDTTVADFYSKPFIYVYNSADKSAVYKQLVDSIRNEYETYLYAKLPLIADTKVTPGMLAGKNVFLIGEQFTNCHVREYARLVAAKKPKCNKSETMLTQVESPYSKEHLALLYTSGKGSRFVHSINYPWIRGFRRTIIVDDKKK